MPHGRSFWALVCGKPPILITTTRWRQRGRRRGSSPETAHASSWRCEQPDRGPGRLSRQLPGGSDLPGHALSAALAIALWPLVLLCIHLNLAW